jgi:hypothetical protein
MNRGEKLVRNISFGEITKHLDNTWRVFCILQVIYLSADRGRIVAFAMLASTIFRVVQHCTKYGMKLEFGTTTIKEFYCRVPQVRYFRLPVIRVLENVDFAHVRL